MSFCQLQEEGRRPASEAGGDSCELIVEVGYQEGFFSGCDGSVCFGSSLRR